MTIKNFKFQEHKAAWEKLRNEIFVAQEGQEIRALFSDPGYEKIVKEVAKSLSDENTEESEFKDKLRLSLDKITSQFTLEGESTKLEDIYDLTAYSLTYGVRSVAGIQVALLEYFMDFSRIYFSENNLW